MKKIHFFIFLINYVFINAMEEKKELSNLKAILTRFDNNISENDVELYCQYRKAFLNNEKINEEKKIYEALISKCENTKSIHFYKFCEKHILEKLLFYEIFLLISSGVNYFNYFDMSLFIPGYFVQKDNIMKSFLIMFALLYFTYYMRAYLKTEINMIDKNVDFQSWMTEIKNLESKKKNLDQFAYIKKKFNKIDPNFLKIINDIVDGINNNEDDIDLYQTFLSEGSSFKEIGDDVHKKYYFYSLLKKLFENFDEKDKGKGENILNNFKMRFNIIDFIPVIYNKTKNIKTVKLYGYEKFIEEKVSSIKEYFAFNKSEKSEKSESYLVMNYIFYGIPGTGKTEFIKNIVHQVAEAEEILFFEIKNADLEKPADLIILQNTIESYLKEEKKIIIFIDEFEGILKNRNDKILDPNSPTYNLITQFLQFTNNIKNKNCIILAATNHIEKIDEAAIRRFISFEFLLPNYEERYAIIDSVLSNNNDVAKELFGTDFCNNECKKRKSFINFMAFFLAGNTQYSIVQTILTFLSDMKEEVCIEDKMEAFYKKTFSFKEIGFNNRDNFIKKLSRISFDNETAVEEYEKENKTSDGKYISKWMMKPLDGIVSKNLQFNSDAYKYLNATYYF